MHTVTQSLPGSARCGCCQTTSISFALSDRIYNLVNSKTRLFFGKARMLPGIDESKDKHVVFAHNQAYTSLKASARRTRRCMAKCNLFNGPVIKRKRGVQLSHNRTAMKPLFLTCPFHPAIIRLYVTSAQLPEALRSSFGNTFKRRSLRRKAVSDCSHLLPIACLHHTEHQSKPILVCLAGDANKVDETHSCQLNHRVAAACQMHHHRLRLVISMMSQGNDLCPTFPHGLL